MYPSSYARYFQSTAGTRRATIVCIILITSIVTLLPLSAYTSSHLPSLDEMHSTLKQKWKTHSSALHLSSHKNKCPTTNCPSDPYVQPGMLYFGNSSRETRWVPFHVDIYTSEEEEEQMVKKLSEVDLLDVQEVKEYAAEALMAGLVDERERTIGWARDAYVLCLDERNNVENFCKLANGAYSSWGPHQGGICQIAWLNLTVANWFFFGMVDDEGADWWKASEYRPLTFEERIPQVMVPGMEAKGFDAKRKPDLVVLSSLFWDESYISELAQHYNISTDGTHGFTYAQIKWHRTRVQQLISYTREWFNDQSIPMMFRTRQIRKQARWAGLLKIFQLDQSCRAVAKEMGLRYFTWGGKLEGFQDYYDDDQHFRDGPATWLFGDMTLFYLRRAITPGCWTCHQWDD